MSRKLGVAVVLLAQLSMRGASLPAPEGLEARGADSRIDLKWRRAADPRIRGYAIYRSAAAAGPFRRLNAEPHRTHLYSDFFGSNGRTYHYAVSAVDRQGGESPRCAAVSAASAAMTDEELLTSVQEACFRYFYDYGHPASGLASERTGSSRSTIGGSGFGLMTIVVGAERGFVSREDAAARILKILTFLEEKAERHHGAWPHHLDGASGETRAFAGPRDDGGDLVETSYLVQGFLVLRGYFVRDTPVEREIRARATRLWEGVEWDWYLRTPGGTTLFWHWSPRHGWAMKPIRLRFRSIVATKSDAHMNPKTQSYSFAAPYESFAWSGGVQSLDRRRCHTS